jgi:hypothetical protein
MAYLPFVKGEERAVLKHQKGVDVFFSTDVCWGCLEWESGRGGGDMRTQFDCRKQQIFYRMELKQGVPIRNTLFITLTVVYNCHCCSYCCCFIFVVLYL